MGWGWDGMSTESVIAVRHASLDKECVARAATSHSVRRKQQRGCSHAAHSSVAVSAVGNTREGGGGGLIAQLQQQNWQDGLVFGCTEALPCVLAVPQGVRPPSRSSCPHLPQFCNSLSGRRTCAPRGCTAPPQVPHEGDRVPYRLLYSSWLSDWVQRLDPGAPDELYILARGEYDTCTATGLRQ